MTVIGKEMSVPMKRNGMKGVLGLIYVHIDQTGTGESPGDGEMKDMTLPPRHRTRNFTPDGLRPSTLPLGHGCSPQLLY